MYYRSLGGLSILYFRTITYTCMHACARALHDAVKASTPVERNFLQLGPGPFLGWGRRFCPWYCYRKTKKTKQKKTKKKYCTVEIPTEMEFTGTFQKYLQCVNRMWFSNIRSVCLSRLTDYSMDGWLPDFREQWCAQYSSGMHAACSAGW